MMGCDWNSKVVFCSFLCGGGGGDLILGWGFLVGGRGETMVVSTVDVFIFFFFGGGGACMGGAWMY